MLPYVSMAKPATMTVTTKTGRVIPAPPMIRLSTNRKTSNDLRAVKQWLIQQAIEEAESRRDDHNLSWISREKASNLPPASVDLLNIYLFDEVSPFWDTSTGSAVRVKQ